MSKPALQFRPNDVPEEAAPAMLDDFARWTEAMEPLREKAVTASRSGS